MIKLKWYYFSERLMRFSVEVSVFWREQVLVYLHIVTYFHFMKAYCTLYTMCKRTYRNYPWIMIYLKLKTLNVAHKGRRNYPSSTLCFLVFSYKIVNIVTNDHLREESIIVDAFWIDNTPVYSQNLRKHVLNPGQYIPL